MIVQCELCSTRFKLDDSKVKDEGVRVRCSKCRHVFIVRKERHEPQEEADFDSLLNGLVASSQPQETADVPSPADAGTAGQFSGISSEELSETGSDFERFGTTSGSVEDQLQDESPFVFDESGAGTDQPTGHDSAESLFPGAGDSVEIAPPWQLKDNDSSLRGDVDEEGEEDEAASGDMAGATPAVEGGDPQETTVNWFGDSGAGEPEAASGKGAMDTFAGISWEPQDAGVPKESESLPDKQVQPEGSVDLSDTPVVVSSSSEPFDIVADEPVPLSIPSTRRSGSPFPFVVVAISALCIVALAVAGFFMIKGGPAALDTFGIRSMANWAGGGKGDEGGISIRGTVGEFVVNQKAGELFVIRGEVFNAFSKPRTSIQLKAVLYNAKGVVLSSRNLFCGNSLTVEQLKTLPLDQLTSSMSQPGASQSNLDVKPGGTIPFVVVFPNVPDDATEFAIEVVGST